MRFSLKALRPVELDQQHMRRGRGKPQCLECLRHGTSPFAVARAASWTARISDAVQDATADPAMQQHLAAQSLRSNRRHAPDFMAGFMRTELATWRETGRLAGVIG